MSNGKFMLLLIIMIEILAIRGCLFNSCPHRRLRERRCQKCGDNETGICTLDSYCCSKTGCFFNETCKNAVVCALKKCMVGVFQPGFCTSSNLCCSQNTCQESSLCYRR